MRRTKEESLETRTKILASAFDVFSEKAFSNASLTEIAARAGLSKGALYWHFRNKNDLLLNIVEEICRNGEKSANAALSAADNLTSVRQYFTNAYLKFDSGSDRKKIQKIIMRKGEWPEEVQKSARRLILESLEREKSVIERVIANGQKTGRIRPGVSASDVALILSSVFHGLGALLIAEMLPPEFPQHVNILFDAFEKELRAKED